jgi:pantoate--beta-alanine ligase
VTAATMTIARTVAEARDAARHLPRPLGFVPTMGALHRGHLALIDAASGASRSVVASIFVNPLQFGPDEDFDRYPRAFETDCSALAGRGVSLLFAPSVTELVPSTLTTAIDVGPLAERFEGEFRPGHFRGVATIVAKLLHAVEPDVLYLGAKDAQQARVIAIMMRDLNLAARLEIVPTVREPDGLALSSRNVYLSPEERRAAPSLYRALMRIAEAVARGGRNRESILADARRAFEPPMREAYLDIVDATTFEPLVHPVAPALAIGSAWLGSTRLLDNIPILR